MYTQDDYLVAGMEYAKTKAQTEGLDIEQPVSHPRDLRLLPYAKAVDAEYPSNELFNSRVAINHGRKVLHAQASRA